MFCPNCGSRHGDTNAFCGSCGAALAPRVVTQPSSETVRPSYGLSTGSSTASELLDTITAVARERQTADSMPLPRRALTIPVVIVGFVLGGMVGFVLRPSVFLVGQLPLGTVLTRGANLSGLDQLLVAAAQSSFNMMIVVALVGAAVGAGIGAFLDRQSHVVRK